MILQCNAAQFDDRSELDTDLKSQAGTNTNKSYSKQEVFHLLPELINRSIEVNGNPDHGVITALSLMQHNIDTILFDGASFDGNMAKAHNINLNSNLLSEIEQLIKNNTQSNQCAAIDHDTVDVIKMMFDIIFEDDRLTDDAKLMLAKLQIPLLKVAIIDKSYFSGETHPAEVLVNKLTDAALALKKDDKSLNSSFEQETSLIVSRVLNEFSDDASIFKKIINTSPLLNGKELNEKLNGKELNGNNTQIGKHKPSKSITNLRETTEKLKSLARKNEAQKNSATTDAHNNKTNTVNLKSVTAKKPVKTKPARENQAINKNQKHLKQKTASPAISPKKMQEQPADMNRLIANAIKTRAMKSELPDEVKEFLITSWTTVATKLYKTHGENNPIWKKTMIAVDDMIWAFQPKTSRMDKLRLSSIIPGILTTIQDGLLQTRQHSDYKSKLFSLLLSIHATNLKEQRLQNPA